MFEFAQRMHFLIQQMAVWPVS